MFNLPKRVQPKIAPTASSRIAWPESRVEGKHKSDVIDPYSNAIIEYLGHSLQAAGIFNDDERRKFKSFVHLQSVKTISRGNIKKTKKQRGGSPVTRGRSRVDPAIRETVNRNVAQALNGTNSRNTRNTTRRTTSKVGRPSSTGDLDNYVPFGDDNDDFIPIINQPAEQTKSSRRKYHPVLFASILAIGCMAIGMSMKTNVAITGLPTVPTGLSGTSSTFSQIEGAISEKTNLVSSAMVPSSEQEYKQRLEAIDTIVAFCKKGGDNGQAVFCKLTQDKSPDNWLGTVKQFLQFLTDPKKSKDIPPENYEFPDANKALARVLSDTDVARMHFATYPTLDLLKYANEAQRAIQEATDEAQQTMDIAAINTQGSTEGQTTSKATKKAQYAFVSFFFVVVALAGKYLYKAKEMIGVSNKNDEKAQQILESSFLDTASVVINESPTVKDANQINELRNLILDHENDSAFATPQNRSPLSTISSLSSASPDKFSSPIIDPPPTEASPKMPSPTKTPSPLSTISSLTASPDKFSSPMSESSPLFKYTETSPDMPNIVDNYDNNDTKDFFSHANPMQFAERMESANINDFTNFDKQNAANFIRQVMTVFGQRKKPKAKKLSHFRRQTAKVGHPKQKYNQLLKIKENAALAAEQAPELEKRREQRRRTLKQLAKEAAVAAKRRKANADAVFMTNALANAKKQRIANLKNKTQKLSPQTHNKRIVKLLEELPDNVHM